MAEGLLLARLAERTGMNLAGAQRRRILRVLARARADTGLSAASYLELIAREPESFQRLLDDITVGETYFFRERAQLELVRDALQAARSAGRAPVPLQAWSAGCSTGEEAYTLALLLHRLAGPAGVTVVGTDLSAQAVATARRATYGPRALRAATDAERADGFVALPDRRFRVQERYRRTVRFEVRNLLAAPPATAAFDVVLCRNVLIYLAPDAVSQVARRARDALAPTGWLLTGVADPILEVDGLERVAHRDGGLYRRTPTRTRPAPAVNPEQPGDRSPRPAAVRRPRRTAVPQPAPSPVTAAEPRREPEAGSLPAALDAVRRDGLDARLRYRLALLHLEQADLQAAAEAARAAAYLEPGLVVAHVLLGRVSEAMGDQRSAVRSFRAAAQLLARLPEDTLVPEAGGETALQLAHVVGAALAQAPAQQGSPS